jgi:hypothetical protein
MFSLDAIARALGGEVAGHQVLAPAPGHSASDRGMSVRLDGPDGLLVHLFNGGDDLAAKDYVREKIGAEPWKPRRGKLNGHSRRPDDEIDEILAGPTSKSAPMSARVRGKLVRKYDYLDLAGNAVCQLRRFDPKRFEWWRPDGAGWLAALDGVAKIPYCLPELARRAGFRHRGREGLRQCPRPGPNRDVRAWPCLDA